jgi:hypothetical protein
MIRFVMVASLLVGCRYSLETDEASQQVCVANLNSPTCVAADDDFSLAFIEQSIFVPGCAFTACHSGSSTAAGRTDLRPGKSHASLVNVASAIEPTRNLVVPNDVNSSYLMLMLRAFPPEEATPPGEAPPERAGFMPKGNMTLCCQKIDAIERWIMAGAPMN